jgi:hypothetical protein
VKSHSSNGANRNLHRVYRDEANVLSTLHMGERCNMKTATDRAAEAIEAAELMFASEMGVTLNLTPAAKVALSWNVAAAIQRAVAEERARLVCAH